MSESATLKIWRGLDASAGHRIIEIGCIELANRRPTGQKFHRYLNPEREIDAGALAVHGIELAKLLQAPKFAEVAIELVAHVAKSVTDKSREPAS